MGVFIITIVLIMLGLFVVAAALFWLVAGRSKSKNKSNEIQDPVT